MNYILNTFSFSVIVASMILFLGDATIAQQLPIIPLALSVQPLAVQVAGAGLVPITDLGVEIFKREGLCNRIQCKESEVCRCTDLICFDPPFPDHCGCRLYECLPKNCFS